MKAKFRSGYACIRMPLSPDYQCGNFSGKSVAGGYGPTSLTSPVCDFHNKLKQKKSLEMKM